MESASNTGPTQWEFSTNCSLNTGTTIPQGYTSENEYILPNLTSSSKQIYSHLSIHESKNNPERLMCHICGYKAYTPSILQIHIRKHTGEKPFRCPHCSYGSAQSSNLSRHIKAHHVPTDDSRQRMPKPFILPDQVQGMTQLPIVTQIGSPLSISHLRIMQNTREDVQHPSLATRGDISQEGARAEAQSDSVDTQAVESDHHEREEKDDNESINSSEIQRNSESKYINL